MHVDQLGALLRVFLRDQPVDRHLGKLHIGVELGAIFEGELLRLGKQVHIVCAAKAHRFDIVLLNDIQDLQCRNALPVGRQLPDIPAAIVAADRFDPFAGMLGEVFLGQVAADAFHEGRHRVGHLTLVEDVAPFGADLLERVGKQGPGPHLAGARAAAVAQEGLAEAFVACQSAGRGAPVVGDQLGNRKAFARVSDGGGEHLVHRQLAEAFVQLEPPIDCAGHADWKRTISGQRRQPFLLQHLQRQPLGGSARGIQPIQLLGFGIPDDREQVAANAIAGWFHHTQGSICSNRGIDRASACFQDVECDLRCKWLTGGRHAVLRIDLRTSRPRQAGDAILRGACRSEPAQSEHGQNELGGAWHGLSSILA